jgi:hypothetical protein
VEYNQVVNPILVCLAILASATSLAQQPTTTPPANTGIHSPEINTTLMETTFLVSGPSSKSGEEGKARCGTGFVMMRLSKPETDIGQHVLVTAKHVFEDIAGDTATLLLRTRNAAGDVATLPLQLKIRANGKALYTEHPTADVAAIDLSPPANTIIYQMGSMITTPNWLASDQFLEDIGMHPGDELLTLGYPMCFAANDAGYSILRSGKIASYPIIPLKKSGRILYDFRVYPGNSGGPVYFSFSERLYRKTLQLGTEYQKIFGLVTSKADPVNDVDPSLGVIVPSIYIKETIDKLAGFEFKSHD